jgi:hypothetical protein
VFFPFFSPLPLYALIFFSFCTAPLITEPTISLSSFHLPFLFRLSFALSLFFFSNRLAYCEHTRKSKSLSSLSVSLFFVPCTPSRSATWLSSVLCSSLQHFFSHSCCLLFSYWVWCELKVVLLGLINVVLKIITAAFFCLFFPVKSRFSLRLTFAVLSIFFLLCSALLLRHYPFH